MLVLTRRLMSIHTDVMLHLPRDVQIVRSVARFHQLRTSQIDALFFQDNRSGAPLHRLLKRMHEQKYLHRLGGHGGQYVYSLGALGFRHLTPRGGRYSPARSIDNHSLAIADDYIVFHQIEREGFIHIKRYAIESRDIKVEEIEIRPDLEVVFECPGDEVPRHWWIEADLGTEDARQLREKIARMVDARQRVGVYEQTDGSRRVVYPYPFPHVVFTVPDEYRRYEISEIVSRLDEDDRDLFGVVLASDLADYLRENAPRLLHF